jgi:hypothetical protein
MTATNDNPSPLWLTTNPRGVELDSPLIYLIRVTAPGKEFRYVGKASSRSRFETAYQRNIERALAGKPKRPALKRDGTPQREGNLRYRYIHLVLLAAVKNGWQIEHTAICNAERGDLSAAESKEIIAQEANANLGASWRVEDAQRLLEGLL